ncbi:hypothetical protein EV702DRAFT_1047271 [Suillus placidus]|uniref:Uncharacterized protein n=1 Tax=Suillus placidus TaxID=48579 RepID=A0A9P7D1D8_9AGAM|nr:hypothetical protein EV702DRAFT_1047271 [Suillus placidus]
MSVDKLLILAPGLEDIPPLGERHISMSHCLLQIHSMSWSLCFPLHIHLDHTAALSTCPFLAKQERKTAACKALVLAANVWNEVYGNQRAEENLTEFYKSFTVLPSADIMSTYKKTTHVDMVKDLINNPLFPFKFIFGNNLGDKQVNQPAAVAVECTSGCIKVGVAAGWLTG